MKILMLHDDYAEIGGAEVLVNNTIRDLRKKNHNVLLFSFSNRDINKKNLIVIKEPKNDLIRYVNGVLVNVRGYFRLKKVIKKFNPDIIHLHNIDKHILTFLLPIKNRNNFRTIYDFGIVCPSLWGIHKDDKEVCEQGIGIKCIKHKCINPFLYPIHAYLFKIKYHFQKKYIKGYTTATKRLKKYMERQGFTNIFVSPYFTKKKKKSNKNNTHKNILFISNLEKNKGCEYIIKAMPEIIKQAPKSKLTILGSGNEEKALKKLTHKLKLSNNIIFINKVPNKEVEKYYLDSSIVVVPSIWMENSPVVIYEALSLGKPIIATNRGGNPELIRDGINGFIVKPNNAEEISAAVMKIFKSDALYRKLSRNALSSSKEFNIRKYTNNLERIYHRLIWQKQEN